MRRSELPGGMASVVTVFFVTVLFVGGCASRVVSNTPRTAIEQMLLSGAVDASLEKFTLPEMSGRKVFLDFSNLKAYDVEYITVATRARFARLGAILVAKPEEAEYTAEVASGGLGTEFKELLVGMPSIPVPNAQVSLPEAPLYRRDEQTGILKLLIFVHKDGQFVAAGEYFAKADRVEHILIFWRFTTGDDIAAEWKQADVKLKEL